MGTTFDKYNSIPFEKYLELYNCEDYIVDNENKLITLLDENGVATAKVYFSSNIDHEIDRAQLLNNSIPRSKVYYVFENGVKDRDWLWHYGDMENIEDLF